MLVPYCTAEWPEGPAGWHSGLRQWLWCQQPNPHEQQFKSQLNHFPSSSVLMRLGKYQKMMQRLRPCPSRGATWNFRLPGFSLAQPGCCDHCPSSLPPSYLPALSPFLLTLSNKWYIFLKQYRRKGFECFYHKEMKINLKRYAYPLISACYNIHIYICQLSLKNKYCALENTSKQNWDEEIRQLISKTGLILSSKCACI